MYLSQFPQSAHILTTVPFIIFVRTIRFTITHIAYENLFIRVGTAKAGGGDVTCTWLNIKKKNNHHMTVL